MNKFFIWFPLAIGGVIAWGLFSNLLSESPASADLSSDTAELHSTPAEVLTITPDRYTLHVENGKVCLRLRLRKDTTGSTSRDLTLELSLDTTDLRRTADRHWVSDGNGHFPSSAVSHSTPTR